MLTDEQIMEVADRLAASPHNFQGFTHQDRHWIRDVSAPRDQQVIWRGGDHTEMMRQIRFLELKQALAFRKD